MKISELADIDESIAKSLDGLRQIVAINWAGKSALQLLEKANVLKWGVIALNIKTGRAIVSKKNHKFTVKKTPFKIFKVLLQKRVVGINEGEVTWKEFKKETGLNKDTIRNKVRELRRELGISRKRNPLEDIFLETGNGYRLVQPETQFS